MILPLDPIVFPVAVPDLLFVFPARTFSVRLPLLRPYSAAIDMIVF
jgi:hypothetical protein